MGPEGFERKSFRIKNGTIVVKPEYQGDVELTIDDMGPTHS